MPFVLIVLLSLLKFEGLAHAQAAPAVNTVGVLGGTLIAMWNYWGWDNASSREPSSDRKEPTRGP